MVKAETNTPPTPPRANVYTGHRGMLAREGVVVLFDPTEYDRWSERMIEIFTVGVRGNQQWFIPRNPIYFHSEQECKAFLDRSAYQDLNWNGRDQAFCVKKTTASWQKVQ